MSWEEFQASRLGAAQTCSATLAGNHLMRDANALPETVSANQVYLLSSQKIPSSTVCLSWSPLLVTVAAKEQGPIF